MEHPPLAQVRAEKKRVQIRNAAKALFLRSGFLATSTETIAASASISKQTLYRYYASKEDGFVDVVRLLTTERLKLLQWTVHSIEPTSRQDLQMHLRAIARHVLEAMVQPEYQAMARLILAELPRFPERGPLFRQSVSEPVKNAFLALLRQGQAYGVVDPHLDLPVIGRMFFSTLQSYGVLDGLMSNASAPHIPEASVIDAFVRQIMELVSMKNNG